VLIGRSSDPYNDGNNVRLHVEGPLPAAGGRGQMAIATTAAYNATDRKAMLNFSGAYDTGALPTFLAGIAGEKENTTNSNYGGALTLHTRPNGGALAERMRIDSNGKIFMTEGVPFSWADSSQNVAAEIYGDSSDNLIFRNTSAKTERMRIDASGNVGIGETAPDGKLHVRGGSSAGGQIWIQTDGTFAGTDEAQLNFRHYDDTGDASGQIKLIGTTTGGNYTGDMVLSVRGGGTSGAGGATLSEKMRITNDGRVGIGTPSPANTLTILGSVNQLDIETSTTGVTLESIDRSDLSAQSDLSYYARHGEHKFFGAAYTEHMRIDSAGRLLVAQTSGVGIGGTPADVNGTEIGKGYINLNRDDTASANQVQFGKNGSVAGRITTTTTTSYVETSDRRVKSNIADAEDCGTAIDSMQVRKFDWTESGEHHPFGMIAQELLEIAPIAVDAPDDPSEMMGIDYSKLVPMLVKEIQSLRARVQQLENN
jgi:hypothetical protein